MNHFIQEISVPVRSLIKLIARIWEDVAVTMVPVERLLACIPCNAISFPKFRSWGVVFPTSKTSIIIMTMGRSITALAVVDGTTKAMRKLVTISTISTVLTLFPNRVTRNNARRFASPLFSMPEAMTKAAIISQITS